MSENLLPYAKDSQKKIRFNLTKLSKLSIIIIIFFGIFILFPAKNLELIGFGQNYNLWQQAYLNYWQKLGLVITKAGLVENINWLWGQKQIIFNIQNSPFFSWILFIASYLKNFNVQFVSVFFGITLLSSIFILGYKLKSYAFGVLTSLLLLVVPFFQQWGRVLSPLLLQITLIIWLLITFWYFYDKAIFVKKSEINLLLKIKQVFIKNEIIVFWTAIFMILAGLDNLVFAIYLSLLIWLYFYYPRKIWYLVLVLVGILKILLSRYYFAAILSQGFSHNIWQYFLQSSDFPHTISDFVGDKNIYSLTIFIFVNLFKHLGWPLVVIAVLGWIKTALVWWRTNFISRIEQSQVFFLLNFLLIAIIYSKNLWHHPELIMFLDIIFILSAANFILFIIRFLAKKTWHQIFLGWGIVLFIGFLGLPNRFSWIIDKNLYTAFKIKQQISQNLPTNKKIIFAIPDQNHNLQKFISLSEFDQYIFVKPDQQIYNLLFSYGKGFDWLVLNKKSELSVQLAAKYPNFTSGEFMFFSLQ